MVFEEVVGFGEKLTEEMGERMVCTPCEYGLNTCRGGRLRLVVMCGVCGRAL
jgi:hypothetical protein